MSIHNNSGTKSADSSRIRSKSNRNNLNNNNNNYSNKNSNNNNNFANNGNANPNNTALNDVLNQLNMDVIGRVKTEDCLNEQSNDLSRNKQRNYHQTQQHSSNHVSHQTTQSDYEDRDDLDDMDLKPEERAQRDIMMAMQRQAAQMAAAAAAAGLPTAAHFANLAASVSNFSGLNLNSNTFCQLNSALMASNSSPSATSGSSNSATPSSPAIQSIEPGKGYTFEEQFKQVSLPFCFSFQMFIYKQTKYFLVRNRKKKIL